MDAKVWTDDEAAALGHGLADRLVRAGADDILKGINDQRPSKD